MILVIGATGYIGRYFCTEMSKRGVDILALGRSEAVQRFLMIMVCLSNILICLMSEALNSCLKTI